MQHFFTAYLKLPVALNLSYTSPIHPERFTCAGVLSSLVILVSFTPFTESLTQICFATLCHVQETAFVAAAAERRCHSGMFIDGICVR